ncbi:CsbD family protein [Nostoc sp. 3335mG]|nr:CsbD family protein [Nostoc sp. 3335mG]
MNEDEFAGGVRYATGKVEKAVGDVTNRRDWQADGVVDQVAGGAQHAYGRAKSILNDAIDSAPGLARTARDQIETTGKQVAHAAERGGKDAARTVREQPLLWAAGAIALGYGLGWLIHGRHD